LSSTSLAGESNALWASLEAHIRQISCKIRRELPPEAILRNGQKLRLVAESHKLPNQRFCEQFIAAPDERHSRGYHAYSFHG